MKLTADARKQIAPSNFAGPDRSFPIEDASHARAALSMAHDAADPNEIRAKVHAKYPSLGRKDAVKAALMKKMGGTC